MERPTADSLTCDVQDEFWGRRKAQLRDVTLPAVLDRLEETGSLDAFRRLRPGGPPTERRGWWFSDSDVYKWMEAAAWGGRPDLLDPVIDLIDAAVHPDGYLHTFYDAGPGSQPRYRDLRTSHEWYCGGHFTEAALAHHAVTGETVLLDTAVRWADHLCTTFGPGRIEQTDGHPEAELALARLGRHTGDERYIDQAKWIVEHQLARSGLSIDSFELAGHAVRALYLASGIAEIARATQDPRWLEATARLFDSLVGEHSYPTGAIGSRWLDESVGKPFELPDAMSYTESCAAVASLRFCQQVWDLTQDPRALDQIELLAYNAVPCGVGSHGESWFYSQPHAVAEVAGETNPWLQPFEYHQSNLLEWFPARRHRWFDVACCPTNLARMFATVDHHVADTDASGNLRIHLPLASTIRGHGWDVTVESPYPEPGVIRVHVRQAPAGGTVVVRVPGWSGGTGHVPLGPDGVVGIDIADEWWESDRRVEGANDTLYLRRGPVVHCVEGLDVDGVDLSDLAVDPLAPTGAQFRRVVRDGPPSLHHRAGPGTRDFETARVPTLPYHAWANRGLSTMRIRFPRVR